MSSFHLPLDSVDNLNKGKLSAYYPEQVSACGGSNGFTLDNHLIAVLLVCWRGWFFPLALCEADSQDNDWHSWVIPCPRFKVRETMNKELVWELIYSSVSTQYMKPQLRQGGK